MSSRMVSILSRRANRRIPVFRLTSESAPELLDQPTRRKGKGGDGPSTRVGQGRAGTPYNDSSIDAYQNAANRCIRRRTVGGSVAALSHFWDTEESVRRLRESWSWAFSLQVSSPNFLSAPNAIERLNPSFVVHHHHRVYDPRPLLTQLVRRPTQPSSPPSLSLVNCLPECPIYFPTLLCPHPRTGTAQPTLYRARSTRSGSRELKKPMHALPLFDEPVELLARHTPSNDTLQEVQVPIHMRDAEPLGEDLALPFEGPRAFFSCDYDGRVQDPWFLVTRHLDSDSPDAQRLEIHVPVGDRQVDLQVEFGTAFTILACFFGASLGLGRHVDGVGGAGNGSEWVGSSGC
ncbi:hypothetical protein BKA70DRAFT_1447475 [Coprinopsis sp. MPI-PUGE-AT-0042]|nr:hypothetical protein BKA70DRAFT_1447475 [Coprinopsis sp. MPI-PUGE-AT-0042]